MIQSLVSLNDELTQAVRTELTKGKTKGMLEQVDFAQQGLIISSPDLKMQKKEKDTIKVAKEISWSRLSVSFEIVSSGGEKVYEVEISNTPTCTCEDYKKFSGKELCKHIIWIYIFISKVDENSQLIHQITLSEEALQELRIESFTLPH